MQSCHFHSRDMQVGHSHIFEHATTFTHCCNCEFDIFNSVNFATQACILQNVLLNLVLENTTWMSVTPLPVSRYLYIYPFRRNHTDNLQIYKCKVDHICHILTRPYMGNRRTLPKTWLKCSGGSRNFNTVE